MALSNDAWKAFAQYDPAHYRLEAVSGEGPRLVYWNEAELGAQPTEAQIDAAIVAYDEAEAARQTEANALRNLVLATAQSAVGRGYDTLTAAQVRSLFALILHKEGALNAQGVVRPLSEWVRD